ncbi:hypothetical protein ScalyP_jg4981 [Parmales sp. scaly parma]|nr:hypothetical protein ScalyP_jg4981 [Parmales sp. scaly parma]
MTATEVLALHAASSNTNPNPNPTKLSTKKTAVNPRSVRHKGVKVGFGLMDWNLLKSRSKDLAQRLGQPLRTIPFSEVATHNTTYDCWCVLRGQVYNLTSYLSYHPGGVKIIVKCAGADCTEEFDKFHQWINIDGLIKPLLLGTVDLSA